MRPQRTAKLSALQSNNPRWNPSLINPFDHEGIQTLFAMITSTDLGRSI